MQKLPIDHKALKEWFQKEQRPLPWRNHPSPYEVWISEVMLQQTQVTVVQSYYTRWMARFPTISHLAEAEIDAVIKMWEGLGYYSRARNLHRAARYLVEHHGGQLPSTRSELEKVVGLGPYTIGAILSFAFHQKAAAVDGNVIRVLSRYTALEEDVTQTAVKRQIWEYAEACLPDEEPWIVVEALIELGATLCTRQPQCFLCPLRPQCAGLRSCKADLLPVKGKKEAITRLERDVAVIAADRHYLLKRGQQGKLMEDLYEFPYFERPSCSDLSQRIFQELSLPVTLVESLPLVTHTFTRFRAKLYPCLWQTREKIPIPGYHWVLGMQLKQLPFSAGHRRILNDLEVET